MFTNLGNTRPSTRYLKKITCYFIKFSKGWLSELIKSRMNDESFSYQIWIADFSQSLSEL